MRPPQSLCVIFAAVACQCQAAATGRDAPSWTTVFHQHVNRDYLGIRPRTRYGHTATVVGDAIIVVHGYFYDHKGCISKSMCGDGKGATWHSDVWALYAKSATDPANWRQITDGRDANSWIVADNIKARVRKTNSFDAEIIARKAARATVRGERNGDWVKLADEPGFIAIHDQFGDLLLSSAGPPARMNHVAVAVPGGEKLMIFGGSGVKDMKFQDVWQLDTRTRRWTEYKPMKQSAWPTPRDCMSAVVLGNAMVIYGGFLAGERSGELWSFDFQGHQWDLVMDTPKPDRTDHPGRRVAHSAVAAPNGEDMYVVGGFRFQNDVSDADKFDHGKLDDLWLYIGRNKTWRKLPQVGNHKRQWMQMVLLQWPSAGPLQGHLGLLVMGGSLCTPNCSLTGSMAFFSLEKERWYTKRVQKEPLARYHHSFSLYKDALWLFGGESYQPHMYHNGVERFALNPPVKKSGKSGSSEL